MNDFGCLSSALFLLLDNYRSYKDIRASLTHKKEIEYLTTIIEMSLQDAKLLEGEHVESRSTS